MKLTRREIIQMGVGASVAAVIPSIFFSKKEILEEGLTVIKIAVDQGPGYTLICYVKNEFFQKYKNISSEFKSMDDFIKYANKPYSIFTFFHRKDKPAYFLVNEETKEIVHAEYWNNGKRDLEKEKQVNGQ